MQHPIKFEEMPYFCLELTGLSRIAFSVADNPFYKQLKAKYFPELIVVNTKGQVKAKVNSVNRSYMKKGIEVLSYEEDFREQTLKINDDRRIQINLNKLIPSEKKGGAAAAD